MAKVQAAPTRYPRPPGTRLHGWWTVLERPPTIKGSWGQVEGWEWRHALCGKACYTSSIRTSPSKGKRNFAGTLAKREPVQSSRSGAGSCAPAPGYSTRPQGNLDHEVPNLVHPQKYHFLCCLSSRLPLLHQVAGLYWGRIQGTGCYTARSAGLHCSAHHPLPAALVKLPWPTGQVNTPGI